LIVRVGDLESHFSQDTFELDEIIGFCDRGQAREDARRIVVLKGLPRRGAPTLAAGISLSMLRVCPHGGVDTIPY